MRWDQDAEKELEKAPEFVRDMARRKVEGEVEKKGRDAVSLDDVREVFEEYMSYLEPDAKKTSTNIAIIRCERISEACPGTACLLALQGRKVRFKGYGDDARLVAMITCGGCPGKRAVSRAKMLSDRGADVIAFGSCVSRGNPIDFPCPHFAQMKASVVKRIGPEIEVLDYTH